MDSRTRLAVGGMTTVAASVAVICAVALTNSAALAHSDATVVRAGKVVVPAATAPTAAPAPSPSTAPRPVATPEAVATPEPPVAEVVPAPAPVVVAPSSDTPTPGTAPVAGPGSVSEIEAIAEADRSGSWDRVRKWASRWGWPDERVEAWIAYLEKSRDAGERIPRGAGDKPAESPDVVEKSHQSKDRSRWIDPWKERPADAGVDVDNRPVWPGDGAKKDRSRVSPDPRDR